MRELIIKKEHWRNLLSESCKTIIIISLKGFRLENNASVKRMLLHDCQMGLKNPNVFNNILSAKHKPPKCSFTERNGSHLVGVTQTQHIWITKKFGGLTFEKALFSFAGKQAIRQQERGRQKGPKWTILSSRPPRYSFCTAWYIAGLGLGNMQYPIWTLQSGMCFGGASVYVSLLPWDRYSVLYLSMKKSYLNTHSQSVQSNKILFFLSVGESEQSSLGKIAWITIDDTIRLWVYKEYMNGISETTWRLITLRGN